jgi:hypothetical protein
MNKADKIINFPLKTKSTIKFLREKYKGEWIYRGQGNWENIGKGWVRSVAILGGFNGDDYCGSELIYYPNDGTPERVNLNEQSRYSYH